MGSRCKSRQPSGRIEYTDGTVFFLRDSEVPEAWYGVYGDCGFDKMSNGGWMVARGRRYG